MPSYPRRHGFYQCCGGSNNTWHCGGRGFDSPHSNGVFTLEHPKGSIDVTLTFEDEQFKKAGIIRTARKIMSGHIHVPSAIFD